MMFLEKLVIVLFLIYASTEALPKLDVPQNLMIETYRTENNIQRKHVVKRDASLMSKTFGPSSTYSDTSNDHTCFVCRPGFYRTGDCSVNMTVGECQKCPSGTYNTHYNIAMYCAACSPHCIDRNAKIEKQCNGTADMECRCKDGYFNHSKGPGEWICMPHTKCSPGTEPAQLGTSDMDTTCQKCSDGWYSPSKSQTDSCLSCTVCDSGEVKERECNGLEDTICTSKVSDQKEIFLEVGVPIIVVIVVAGVIVAVLVYRYREQCLWRVLHKYRHERNSSEIPTTSVTKIENRPFDQVVHDQPVGYCTKLSSDDNIIPENNWTKVFSIIVSHRGINKDEWKPVIRTLFSKYYNTIEIDNKLFTICHDNQDINEQIYQSLLCWLKRAGDEAYLDEIINALANDNMNGLAMDLRKKFSSLLRRPFNSNDV